MFTIYALVDPRDNAIRYVGMTGNVYQRFQAHLACRGKNPMKDAWITELKKQNVMVLMHTLETVETLVQARKRETYWIAHYEHLGASLLNNVSLPAEIKSKVGRKGHTRIQRALNWALWQHSGFDYGKCPWGNPSEYKKHAPSAQDIAEAFQLLGLTAQLNEHPLEPVVPVGGRDYPDLEEGE